MFASNSSRRAKTSMALLAALVLSGGAFAADAGGAAAPSSEGRGDPHTRKMQEMMHENMKEMQGMSMSGDMDRDFATMMRRHHQQGVRMAQMEVDNGKDPEMKALAKKILSSQQEEIKKFDKWLKEREAKGGSR